jgi:hypothetical protein
VSESEPGTKRAPADDRPLPVPPPAYGHRIVEQSGKGPGAPVKEAKLSGVDPVERRAGCVDYWPEVRYRNYGYDHIVHLLSRCEVVVFCRVSSDVNPVPAEVTLLPRAQVDVLTFRGSPAREFTPKVECRYRV